VAGAAARASGPLRQVFFAQPLASTVEGGLSSPVLGAGGTLLYADVCGGVHMYSTAAAANGTAPAQPLWSFATGAGCGGGYAAGLFGAGADALVVAVAGDAGVFALRADSGALLWRYTEEPDGSFRGSPLFVPARGVVSVATTDPATPIYHLNITTGELVMTTAFDDSAICLASELSLGAWLGADYAFYTACDVFGDSNLMYRIHMDTGAADSAAGFGSTGEHPPIYVEDESSDPVHAAAYDLSDGVLGGVYAGTFDQVSACDLGSEDYAGMALAARSAGRPDLAPPLFVATNAVSATVDFISPLPLQPAPPGRPLPPCSRNASAVLTLAGGRRAALTDALPTVDSAGRVFVADQGGNLFMVERQPGSSSAAATLLWTSPTRQPVFGEVVIDSTGVMYLADYSGAVYGIVGGAL
jgi:outer membrane protein assembly factor BamB